MTALLRGLVYRLDRAVMHALLGEDVLDRRDWERRVRW